MTVLLNGKCVLASAQEVLEVQNAFRAYDLLPSLDPYDLDDLLKIHRVMMEGVVAEAGDIPQSGRRHVCGGCLIHAGTPAQYVLETLQQLFGWL